MAEALSAVRGAFAGLSPSEKRLLVALGAVFGVLLFLGLWVFTGRQLDAIERERADTIEALRVIQRARPAIAARNARRDAVLARYRARAPALTSFVEEQASAAHVRVAEAQDRPLTPVGTRFSERSVSIRLRQVGLDALIDFMDRIEAATFPVAITSIRIRRRYGETNKYDVDDMVISTWDRRPEGEARGANGERPSENSGDTDRRAAEPSR